MRGSEIIDKIVIDTSTGDKVFEVKTIIIDNKNYYAVALGCKESLFKKSRDFIFYKDIIGIDKDYILIKDKSALKNSEKNNFSNNEISFYEQIVDKCILNKNGDVIGIIRDILINDRDGKIIAYEISEGYIEDIINGRKTISPYTNYIFSGDNIIIDDVEPYYMIF